MQYFSPVEYVIRKFGGVRKLARAIGRDAGTVSKWRRPDHGIPRKAQLLILSAAERQGLDITANDLIKGRKVRTKLVREAVV